MEANQSNRILLSIAITLGVIVGSYFFVQRGLFHLSQLQQNTTTCSQYVAIESCPSACVVCPPCRECSSLSCQTEQFCEDIGFDKNWYNQTQQ